MRLCAAGFTSSQRNPRYCDGVGRSIWTNRIRQYIKEKYIDPARRRGAKTIIIKAGEISTEMRIKNGQPAVAGALGANKFEMFAAVETISHEGPIMGAGTVFTFQVLRSLSSLPR